MLVKGAEFKSEDKSSLTPLLYVVGNRQEAVAKLELEKGDDMES